ncbi:MAG: DUF6049 family protein, partial [Propionibacteriaceae bacterium]|nr:DUF6049 family protein [Propionibacteriaceae bacterium]
VQVLDSRGKVLARARLMLTVPAADGPVATALVVPLTSRPALVTPGSPDAKPATTAVFSDDHLAGDLGGDLGKLIAMAGQPGVTALIDPALVDALTQMAAGYSVAADAGTAPAPGAGPAPGTGQNAAKAALTSIAAIAAAGNAYRLPAFNPDVVALAALPQPDAILDRATKTPMVGSLAGLPLAVVADGAITDQVRTLVDGVKPALVLSDALQPSATVQTEDMGAPWVALTPSSTLNNSTGPLPDFGGASTLQVILNRTALLNIASVQGAPVVTMPTSSAEIAAASNWLNAGGTPTGLAHLAGGVQATSFDWRTDLQVAAPSPELTAAVAQTQQTLANLADLGNQPKQANDLGDRVLPGAVASPWNGDWASALAWLQQSTSDLAAQTSGSVTLHVAGQWMLSSRDNRVPITITNDMGMPIYVRVRFTSENPARLSVPETDLVTVAAKSSATVVVNPQAEANGSVRVTVTLITVNGTRIDESQVQVVTTSAGRMGWVIIIGAGVVFVVLTSLRVRQVRRQRAKSKIEAMSPDAEGGDTNVQ